MKGNLRKELVGGLLVFLTTFTVFWASPVHTIFDSRYLLFFSEQLLWQRSFSRDLHAFSTDLPAMAPGEIPVRDKNIPYHLEPVGKRIYYHFPPGSSILSLPYVALMNGLGVSAAHANGTYSQVGEARMQALLAAFLMAGLAVTVFHTSRLLLPFGWSLLVAGATAFGTQVWSTASRAMWVQTWGILLLGFILWLLLKAETKQGPQRPVLLATCLSWLYFVRPTFCTSIIAIALYLLIYHRSSFIRFALTGGAWLAAFIGYSKYHFGQLLPSYYQADRLSSDVFWEAYAGNLISPSRGLFIYVPILLFVIYLMARYWPSVTMPRLVVLALGVIVVHLAVISGLAPGWFGGHGYGPRLSTDMVPWFALLGIFGVQARLRWRDAHLTRDSLFRWRAEWTVGAVLLLCSITLHGIGAVSPRPWHWLLQPADIGETPHRIWDWKHPQFVGTDGENPTPWTR